MENIIGEHFIFSKNFSSLSLIFNIKPEFFIKENGITFFEMLVFQKHDKEIEEGIIRNQKREGFWILWNSKQREADGFFRDGLEEGFWIFWYPNDQKWVEGNYRNGEKEGLWISWYLNGQKWGEGNYVNGEKEGLWKSWDKQGILTIIDYSEEID